MCVEGKGRCGSVGGDPCERKSEKIDVGVILLFAAFKKYIYYPVTGVECEGISYL